MSAKTFATLHKGCMMSAVVKIQKEIERIGKVKMENNRIPTGSVGKRVDDNLSGRLSGLRWALDAVDSNPTEEIGAICGKCHKDLTFSIMKKDGKVCFGVEPCECSKKK